MCIPWYWNYSRSEPLLTNRSHSPSQCEHDRVEDQQGDQSYLPLVTSHRMSSNIHHPSAILARNTAVVPNQDLISGASRPPWPANFGSNANEPGQLGIVTGTGNWHNGVCGYAGVEMTSLFPPEVHGNAASGGDASAGPGASCDLGHDAQTPTLLGEKVESMDRLTLETIYSASIHRAVAFADLSKVADKATGSPHSDRFSGLVGNGTPVPPQNPSPAGAGVAPGTLANPSLEPDRTRDPGRSHSSVELQSRGPSAAAPQRCPHPACSSKLVFTRQCDLDKHYRLHSRGNFCREPGCSQQEGISTVGFVTAKDRDRHERAHHPSIPCRLCGKLFSRQDNLRDHVRRRHRLETYIK